MPYILQERRNALLTRSVMPYTPGELNFYLTSICLDYIGKPSYAAYNEVIGVLECVKIELARRELAPYEDHKKDQNGDVYPTRD